mgnify:CR=1 FL=1
MSQELKQVNKPIRKKDAMNLLLGKPVYVDDVTPHDCLIVKLVHSPHANALIESIDTEAAKAVDTIEAVYTYKMCLRNVLLWLVRLIQNLVLMTA